MAPALRGGPIVFEHLRSVCGWHAHGVDLVLDEHRYAMQWPGEARLLVGCIELVGFFQRVRVDRNHRIDVRSRLVIGIDPVNVALDQLARRKLAGFEGCVDIVGRCFPKIRNRSLQFQ